MRQHYEILIVSPAEADSLFPIFVCSDDNTAQIMRKTEVDSQATGLVHQVLELPITFDSFYSDVLIVFFAFQFGDLFVVPLIDALKYFALDQKRSYSGFGRNESCKIINP